MCKIKDDVIKSPLEGECQSIKRAWCSENLQRKKGVSDKSDLALKPFDFSTQDERIFRTTHFDYLQQNGTDKHSHLCEKEIHCHV
jgi:hypothetical protein